jgi:hypothetical protein
MYGEGIASDHSLYISLPAALASRQMRDEMVLPRAWAERATLRLLLAAQALARVEPPPSLAVPVPLAGTPAFGAGLTVGWMLWGLEPLEGDSHA